MEYKQLIPFRKADKNKMKPKSTCGKGIGVVSSDSKGIFRCGRASKRKFVWSERKSGCTWLRSPCGAL